MSDNQEFLNKKDQLIGVFNFEDLTFRKIVRLSKDLYRMRDAWGIDQETVSTLLELKCQQVRILDEESHRVYSTSFTEFYQHAVLDRWVGESQFFCQRQYFVISNQHER